LNQEEKGEGQSGQRQMPPPSVKTQKIALQDIAVAYNYPARLTSTHEVTVVAKVPGTLKIQHFKEGDWIGKGEVLYEIDPDKYRIAYQQAQANVQVQQAALDTAAKTWERTQALYASNAISKQEYDNAQGRFEQARAALKASRVAVEAAKIDLEDATIYAAISGVASQTYTDAGNYIATPNTPLVTITQLDPVYAEFSLPDDDFFTLKEKLHEVTLLLESSAGKKVEGEIAYMDAAINVHTSTVKLKGVFKNDNNALLPGFFTRVHLEGIVLQGAIVVPQEALVQDPSGMYVYVIKEGKAHKTPVEIGQATEGKYVITSGLEGGEVLILDNLTKLRQGMPVNVAEG
jgi:membrane fusion protein (multidrug efflux system)